MSALTAPVGLDHRGADETTPAPTARAAALLAVLIVLVGIVIGPMSGFDSVFGVRATTVTAGRVEVFADGNWVPAESGDRIADGSRVRAASPRPALARGATTLHLGPDAIVVTGATPAVEAGTVVGEGDQVSLSRDLVAIEGTGFVRVEAIGRYAVYAGSAVVTDAADAEVLVRAYEEVRGVDGIVRDEPRPYVYVDTDPFDRVHLANALAVDDVVAALHRGVEAEYGTSPQTLGFYTDFDGIDGAILAVLDDLGVERDGERVGPPSDVLVASVVTEAVVEVARLDPPTAAGHVRDLRVDGATWGLIATTQHVTATDVRAAAERALNRRLALEDAGVATPVTNPPPGPGLPPVVDPTRPPTDGPDTDPGTDPPDPGTDPPDPGPDPDDPGLLETILDTVSDVVDDLIGDEPADLDDGPVEDIVDDVVDDVVVDIVDEVVDSVVTGVVPEIVQEVLPPAVSEPLNDTLGGVGDVVGGVLGGTGEASGEVARVVDDTVPIIDSTIGGLLGR